MKKIITLAVLGMLGAVPVSAQTVYDAANIANKDLNGTARFVWAGLWVRWAEIFPLLLQTLPV